MAAPATEPVLASERNDAALALALGGLSAIERLERAVAPARSDGLALDADDPVVLASLGALALGRILARWLAHASAPLTAAAPPSGDVDRSSSRQLLR